MLNRYRIKMGITERFGTSAKSGIVNGNQLVKIPSCNMKPSAFVVEYYGASIEADAPTLS